MAWYRKTTPSSYPNTPASNFTDSTKNWRKHSNLYRYTSGFETASLTAVPGRYTDSTRTWRRIKALYRYTSSGTWQKVFGKFAGQPYPTTPAAIRYTSYTGTDVGPFAMMGPGADSIAQGNTGVTFLWGRDAQDWQNIESLTSRSRTFVFGSRPLESVALQVTNDEGNFEGDKLRNTEAVILQYDKQYVWYRDRISVAGASTGTSYSQTVRIIKQQPVINSLGFKTNNIVSAGSRKDVSFSIANEWYRSIDQSTSMFKWYILDGQYDTPTEAKLWNSTFVSSVILTENATTITGEDFFTIPTTFNSVSTTGKWLHVKLILKNSSSDTDVDYTVAPYNDVTDYVVAQISGAVPIGTNGTVTMSRTNTSYTVSVADADRGTWTNTPTSYRYQWYLQEQTVGSAYTWSPISGATSSTYDASLYKPTGTSASNRIVPVVWASNSSGESNQGNALTNSGGVAISSTAGGITIANPTSSTSAMIKYKLPTITTFTVTPGSRKIDYVADFSKDDSAATATLSWTGQATGSTTVTSSSSSQSYSPLAAGTYNFTLTITNASTNALTGSATAVQNSKVVTGVATYQFNFGNRLYVGTNGTIRLDVPTGVQTPSYYPTPEYSAAGRLVAVFPKDLVQGNSNLSTADGNGYLLYYSDDNNYFIRWDGYTYNNAGVAAQRVTYYARFTKPIVSGGVTTNYPYVDIYMQNRGSSVGTSSYNIGYYADGIEYGTSYGNTVAANTIYRIYTDGRAAETITYMPTPTAAEMLSFGPITAKNTVGASFSSADEGYSSVLTSANQYVVPTLTVGTVTSTNTDISIPFTTGAAYSSYDIDVKTVSHTGTSITGYPKNSETASPAVISSLTGGTTYYITMTPKNSLGIKGSPIQFTKDTPSTPGNLSSVVLKSFANGYLRLFATTGTNTTKIQYYAVRYNPSIFSVEYIPSSGSTTFNASSSTSYYVGQIDASAKSFNGSYSWTTSSTPYNGTAPGTSTTSGSALATGADNPTISYTTTAGDGKIDLSSIALGGAGNYYTIDVKTTSQTGTSITGYPKVQQTATTQSITGTNGTTYYIRLTPHYYYTIDSTTDSNSIKYTGTSADASAAPAAALGAFTIYAANASVAPAAPTPTITRQSTTSNNLLISWAATKPADVASYNQIIWGEAFSSTYTTEATAGKFGGTLNNYNGSAVYNNPTGPYEDFWVILDNGTTEKSFNIKIEAVGTNASRKAGAFWSESTGAGSYTVEYTISGSTTLTNTSYVSSALSSTTRSFEVTLGTGGGTFTLNQVRAWSNTNGTGAFKYGALLSGQSLSVTPTPKSGISTAASGNFIFYKAASKPANPSAPSVIYRSSRNSHTYTWDVSYTIGTDATSMDVMNQYFTSNSGTYTSSVYDTDPTGSQNSVYDGYIEYRNFASSQTMPLTDVNGYWDNNNSWMRARVRARNASGASSWSGWSSWA